MRTKIATGIGIFGVICVICGTILIAAQIFSTSFDATVTLVLLYAGWLMILAAIVIGGEE